MKRSMLYMFMVGAMAISLSSCVMKQKAVPLTPINAQINFDMDDLEFIGDVTGSTTQSYLLGVIAYGGRKYYCRKVAWEFLFRIHVATTTLCTMHSCKSLMRILFYQFLSRALTNNNS
jgi:hypothetical protein